MFVLPPRSALAVLLLSFTLLPACRPRRDLSSYTAEDAKAALLTEVNLGDPQHAPQLKSGFHQIEENSWRWTEPKFTVELKAPFAAQRVGAILRLKANAPEILILKTNSPITISAKLNGAPLGQATYPKAGLIDFALDVPATALRADTLLFEYTVAPGLPPNAFPGDGRSLGLIVSAIALEKKPL